MNDEQKADADRLVERCASLIEENKVLARRRKEALQSHLAERTKNLQLRESIIKAADLLGERFGSCPLDAFGWSHPNTCDRQCGQDGETDQQIEACWDLYLVEYGKKEYTRKMKG